MAKSIESPNWQQQRALLLHYLGESVINDWGNKNKYPNSKPFSSLKEEISKGDSYLEERVSTIGEKELIRVSSSVMVYLYYTDPITNKRYQLIEDKQVFKDGKPTKHRGFDFVAEKKFPKETPAEGLKRALKEELDLVINEGLRREQNRFKEEYTTIREMQSASYPELKSEYTTYRFSINLTQEEFNRIKDGHMQEESNKWSYFIWKEIPRETDMAGAYMELGERPTQQDGYEVWDYDSQPLSYKVTDNITRQVIRGVAVADGLDAYSRIDEITNTIVDGGSASRLALKMIREYLEHITIEEFAKLREKYGKNYAQKSDLELAIFKGIYQSNKEVWETYNESKYIALGQDAVRIGTTIAVGLITRDINSKTGEVISYGITYGALGDSPIVIQFPGKKYLSIQTEIESEGSHLKNDLGAHLGIYLNNWNSVQNIPPSTIIGFFTDGIYALDERGLEVGLTKDQISAEFASGKDSNTIARNLAIQGSSKRGDNAAVVVVNLY